MSSGLSGHQVEEEERRADAEHHIHAASKLIGIKRIRCSEALIKRSGVMIQWTRGKERERERLTGRQKVAGQLTRNYCLSMKSTVHGGWLPLQGDCRCFEKRREEEGRKGGKKERKKGEKGYLYKSWCDE